MPATNYFWDEDEDNVIEEYDDAGETVATYTTEPTLHGRVISQHRDGQTSYHHYDGEGNTVALTNDDGDVTDRYAYNAFGDVTERTGNTTNPFGYKGALGYYADPETNDYYVRARNYEPTIARWLSADPIGFVDSNSPYVYVGNQPIDYVDPTGFFRIRPGGTIGSVDTTVTIEPTNKHSTGRHFFWVRQPRDRRYVVQRVDVSGAATCRLDCGDTQTVSYGYSWIEIWDLVTGTKDVQREDKHLSGASQSLRYIQENCPFQCDLQLPWIWNQTATFTLANVNLTDPRFQNPKEYFYYTPANSFTKLDCFLGSRHLPGERWIRYVIAGGSEVPGVASMYPAGRGTYVGEERLINSFYEVFERERTLWHAEDTWTFEKTEADMRVRMGRRWSTQLESTGYDQRRR